MKRGEFFLCMLVTNVFADKARGKRGPLCYLFCAFYFHRMVSPSYQRRESLLKRTSEEVFVVCFIQLQMTLTSLAVEVCKFYGESNSVTQRHLQNPIFLFKQFLIQILPTNDKYLERFKENHTFHIFITYSYIL